MVTLALKLRLFISASLITSAIASHATITPAAILPRSLDPAIIGYTSTFGTYSPFHCPAGSIFLYYGSYGRCCVSSDVDCFMPTACLSGSMMVNDQYTTTCNGTSAQTSCITGTVYKTSGDTNPIMNYQCWPTWSGGNWAATQTVPELQASVASTTPSSPSPTPSSTTPIATSPPSGSSTSIASSPLPSTTQSSSPSATSTTTPKPSTRKAWIAGPIVGSIVFASLLIVLVIYLHRKSKRMGPEPGNGVGNGNGSDVVEISAVRPLPEWYVNPSI
ncbi:hypothetical protein K432DRAFT_193248 [Lepidopterella palustris CBS 459.81]|uniref:Uncharacterized protein n=1 Tax=Lepidopterella palustris CBS 459.81 TaxID=1314670 RepID=A0A8E2DZX9_9PEZI|nr:hypothetical protein K432DRAFT_193248 [Lepidopterella palustris CBS 459.81]